MIENISVMDEKESGDLRYRLRATPRIPIAEVPADALVKVRGYVSTEGKLISAPITGTACALYTIEWREVVSPPVDWRPSLWNWETGETWTPPPPLHLEAGGCDLLLDDGTAQARVRINGARVSLLGVWKASRAQDFARDSRGLPGGRLRSKLQKPKPGPDQYVEYREARVESGALLTVIGHATYEADPRPTRSEPRPGAPYRATHNRCVLAVSDQSPLYVVSELIVSLDAVG